MWADIEQTAFTLAFLFTLPFAAFSFFTFGFEASLSLAPFLAFAPFLGFAPLFGFAAHWRADRRTGWRCRSRRRSDGTCSDGHGWDGWLRDGRL